MEQLWSLGTIELEFWPFGEFVQYKFSHRAIY